MNTTEKKELMVEVQAQGYAIRIDKWPDRATYYKPDGEALPNLPADPYSMRRYLRGGRLTLTPPENSSLQVETKDPPKIRKTRRYHKKEVNVCPR